MSKKDIYKELKDIFKGCCINETIMTENKMHEVIKRHGATYRSFGRIDYICKVNLKRFHLFGIRYFSVGNKHEGDFLLFYEKMSPEDILILAVTKDVGDPKLEALTPNKALLSKYIRR